MAADGSIIFKTALDNKTLEKELNHLNKRIQSLENQLNTKKQAKLPMETQLESINQKIATAKSNLQMLQEEQNAIQTAMAPGASAEDYMAAYANQERVNAAVKEQETETVRLQKEWDGINRKIVDANTKIENMTSELNQAKNEAGEIQKRLAATGPGTDRMAKAMERAQKSANRFSLRLREVIRSALVFTVISQGLAALREWMGKVIKTNEEATAAIAKLKGALLTLAQPLLDVVIPAFVTFLNILTHIVTIIAKILSTLFGTTIDASAEAAENLYNETEAIERLGGAAKKAGKSLASFDTINQLSGGEAGTGSGSGEGTTISPDFNFEDVSDGALGKILELVQLIGSALLGWKIGSALKLGLQKTLWLMLAIYSTVEFVKNLFDAWTNGVDLSNLLGMLASAAGIAVGLGMALGPVAAGISLIATGLTMLVTAFHDASENGWDFYNLMLSIAGILATGIGIAILTGSWIPLLIAAIASLLLAFTVATGHGKELIDGIKLILQGFIDFFKGVFTGDLETALNGVGEIFDGLKKVIGSIIDGIKDTFLSFLDWLDEKTGGKLSPLIDFIKEIITDGFDYVKRNIGIVVDTLKDIFSGLVKFVSGVFTQDWDTAWEGVKDIFKGIWNGIVSLLESAVNFLIDGVNFLFEKLNTISFEVPDWIPGIGGESLGFNLPPIEPISIPRLAKGTVIPPNREFLAVLGDQKQGTNIETPLSTMVQAFRTALSDMGYNGEQTAILQVDKDVLGKVVYKLNKAESRRIGVNLTGV